MSRSTVVNILLVAAVVALFAVPVLFVPGEYAGSDGQAGEAIEATGYQPWFSPVWEPPSGEIESGIFAMQAAAGAAPADPRELPAGLALLEWSAAPAGDLTWLEAPAAPLPPAPALHLAVEAGPAAEAAAKLAVEVHKPPNLAFWREGRVLGCLPRVRDWSDYMAAIPRLLAD